VDESYVKCDANSITFAGPDAVHMYRVLSLMNAISLHKKSGLIPTRGMGIMRMFKQAQEFTGQTYKRGEHDRAIDDLHTWIQLMRSSLPLLEG
jgi:hypothetical protein